MIRLFESGDHVKLYAQFRPEPAASLVASIIGFVKVSQPLTSALDVGCGSGQNTRCLAKHFSSVTATDISPGQIQQAQERNQLPNVRFLVCAAEEPAVPPGSVQLVTAAVCAHYLDKPRFFAAADTALVPGGVIAMYCNLPPEVWRDGEQWKEMSQVIQQARKATWHHWAQELDAEVRDKFRHEKYRIPYSGEVREDGHFSERPLTLQLLLGTISTWSGFQAMVRAEGAEAGQKVLEEAEHRYQELMRTVESSVAVGHTITMRWNYFHIMARKPEYK